MKFASIQAISGDTASLGTDQVTGIEVAIDDLGGKLLGHDIQLTSLDDGCVAATGTTSAQRVASDKQIVGVIGTSCSGAAVPAMEILSEAGFTMISGSNTSPILTSAGGVEGSAHKPGYFRIAHNDEIQGRAAATFAFENLGVTKAATINDGDPYTQGLTAGFEAPFKEMGGEIVVSTAINKGDTDMRPVLTEIAAAGAELIFFPIFQPEGDHVVRQAKDVDGLANTALMGADGLLSDTYIKIEEVHDTPPGPKGTARGMYLSGPNPPAGSAYTEFVAKYKAKAGTDPIQAFHAHAYDAFMVFAEAIK
jgi:branched-chain amino acid transport system substrate-binding protein